MNPAMGRLAAILMVALSAGGCASVFNLAGSNYHPEHESPAPHPQVYGGVRDAVKFLRCGSSHGPSGADSYMFTLFVDLPASIVLDTVLLPITIPFEIFGSTRTEGPASKNGEVGLTSVLRR